MLFYEGSILCDKCLQLRTVGWLNVGKDVQCTLFIRGGSCLEEKENISGTALIMMSRNLY